MTIGVYAVPWWLGLVLAMLAAAGLWMTVWATWRGLCMAAGWWRAWRCRRRRGQSRGVSDDCWFGAHEDCDGCECGCGHPAFALEDLPPERAPEELGFSGTDAGLLGPVASHLPGCGCNLHHLTVERERRPSWWEAEHRAAYESLGLDYPSGLVARVRELAP